MKPDKKWIEICDLLDEEVFSDRLENADNLILIKFFMKRWKEKIDKSSNGRPQD